jgi:hypothetical protein
MKPGVSKASNGTSKFVKYRDTVKYMTYQYLGHGENRTRDFHGLVLGWNSNASDGLKI